MPDDCQFCKIISGVIPTTILGKNEFALAFRDINPQAPVHILIIPMEHIDSCRDFNENNIHNLSEMALLANKIADEEKITESGYRWVLNTGDNGGQTVGHIHLHLFGGRNMDWPPG